MKFETSRLRAPEWILGAASATLLASMFLTWYSVTGPLAPTAGNYLGQATSLDGWQSLHVLRWLILITSFCGLSVWYLQAARRAPALPISMTVIATLLALFTAIAVVYRVVIDEPGSYSNINQRFGAFLGMFSAIVMVAAGYRSMRVDGIAPDDWSGPVETVKLDRPR